MNYVDARRLKGERKLAMFWSDCNKFTPEDGPHKGKEICTTRPGGNRAFCMEACRYHHLNYVDARRLKVKRQLAMFGSDCNKFTAESGTYKGQEVCTTRPGGNRAFCMEACRYHHLNYVDTR